MPNRIKGLSFEARMVPDGSKSKLFLGVLGIEYAIPIVSGYKKLNLYGTVHAHKPEADRLLYDYINRTANSDEWAYSDGVLPVYLRFQPDLEFPLDQAAAGIPSGAIYNSYFIELEEPTITITGTESDVDDNGTTTYVDRDVTFVIPINPPASRIIRLGVQHGLMVFLARIR